MNKERTNKREKEKLREEVLYYRSLHAGTHFLFRLFVFITWALFAEYYGIALRCTQNVIFPSQGGFNKKYAKLCFDVRPSMFISRL